MAPAKHALLGPSSAERWINCTPSAVLEAKFPDTASKYAEEGTLAHAVVEEKLTRIIAGKPRGEVSASLKKKIEKAGYKVQIMSDYADEHVDFVIGIYDMLLKEGREPALFSEQKVDFSDYVPNGFGTTDTVIISTGTMYVFDFKYGRGVKVSAKDNPQLKLYALGALNEYGLIYDDISNVEMYIIQPRVDDGISSDHVSVADLKNWADTVVRPRADMAALGIGDSVEGPWCGFCRAKTVCKARAIKFLEQLKLTENNPKLLNEAELAKLLPIAKYISGWADELKDYMSDCAIKDGIVYPGYKVVEGVSRREITDEKKAAFVLTNAGYLDIYDLKGITSLEAMVGKTKFAEMMKGLIEKPKGKPTLVPDSDPRPPYNSENMFDDEEEENK